MRYLIQFVAAIVCSSDGNQYDFVLIRMLAEPIRVVLHAVSFIVSHEGNERRNIVERIGVLPAVVRSQI